MKITLNINNQNIFFISDIHFNHKNVLNFDNRPYVSIEDMNRGIVENWNSVVADNDIVFFLGDFSFSSSMRFNENIINQLNGKIYFIVGNHDKPKNFKDFPKIIGIYDLVDLYIDDVNSTIDLTDKLGVKQHIVLCHYPIVSWNRQHYGSWMLHGHCHTNLYNTAIGELLYKGNIIDVGCMNGVLNYTPISYQDLKHYFISKREVVQ
jgi:calcineurin-like phosphoesterase family protein